ncbi:MAG: hypothetical protein JRG85_18360, partial [Deltaproteobacteria bacterium]|nr:hypothetical protein [Deltaproteobacteria bacterium]
MRSFLPSLLLVLGVALPASAAAPPQYVRDADLAEPMRPLSATSAAGLVLLEGEDGFIAVDQPEGAVHGPGCLPGMAASERVIEDGLGGRRWGSASTTWTISPAVREWPSTRITSTSWSASTRIQAAKIGTPWR